MHFGNLVIVPVDESKPLEKRVEEAMGPHENDGGFWDWWQIGGRWTGALDGYDPEQDPKNIQVCDLCGGTGDRATYRNEPKTSQHSSGCNGCLGKGKRATWPTQWAQHPGDIMPVENLTDEHLDKFYRIVYPGGIFENHESTSLARDMTAIWIKENFKGHLAVVVDNHS